MIKAVIFDWAGTTVDFGSRAPMGAFVKLFQENGISISIDEARIPMGMNKWDHIQALLSLPQIQNQWQQLHGQLPISSDIDRLLAQFIPMNKLALQENSELIPGVVQVVQQLEFDGVQIGSTTGYVRELMDILIPIASEAGYRPEICICSGETELGRPSPQMMKRCASFFGIDDPQRIIKVDDTLPGIQEGQNFGSWTVGVALSGNALGLSLKEFNQLHEKEKNQLCSEARERIAMMEPDFVIDSVADLMPVVTEINQRMLQGIGPNTMDLT
jgi:phosphonoacetaldehyde hydrolase